MSEFMMNKHQATNERLKQERTMTEEASKPKTEKKPPYTYEAFMKDLNVHVETKDITREGLYLFRR